MAKKTIVKRVVKKKPAPPPVAPEPDDEVFEDVEVEVDDDDPETPETPDTAATAESHAKKPRIAVDFRGDGTYTVLDAPEDVDRSLTVTIGGKCYAHVDEFEGLWAYREM